MRLRCVLSVLMVIGLVLGVVSAPGAAEQAPAVDNILAGLEKSYAGGGFRADFSQEADLKALGITDRAAGKLWIKRPAMMRWEYETPEKQTIVTDGVTLWIYRPVDRQVLVGKAPRYFRDGKGASFLSDLAGLRRHFEVHPGPTVDADTVSLTLIPKEPTADVAKIHLTIARETYRVVGVVTINTYGDQTRIALNSTHFGQIPADAFFRFTVPEGADVLEMEP